MNAIPIVVLLCMLPSVVPEDPTTPHIGVVRTWNDLVQAKPRAFSKDLRVRIGISTKACPVYGGVTIYCLAEGLAATERHWYYEIGPLPLRVERDPFSEAFWGLLDPRVSVAMVGGHKSGEGPALFMYPVIVTNPSDAISHPKFRFIVNVLGLKFDPAGKPQLTIRVFSPDEPDTRLADGLGAIGWCRIQVTDKTRQPWVPFSMPSDQQNVLHVAAPVWDPLLPIPLPRNLDQRLPSLFPDEPTGKLVLRYAEGKLILKSRFPLVEDPGKRLLARWWRGGKADFSKAGLIRADRVVKSSKHEYTIHLSPALDLTARETLGVQVLYSELGWHRLDPMSSANAISDRTRPVLPVVSNRVDFTAGTARGMPSAAQPESGSPVGAPVSTADSGELSAD